MKKRIRIYKPYTAVERNITQDKGVEDPAKRERRIENPTKYYEMVQVKLESMGMNTSFNSISVDAVLKGTEVKNV